MYIEEVTVISSLYADINKVHTRQQCQSSGVGSTVAEVA